MAQRTLCIILNVVRDRAHAIPSAQTNTSLSWGTNIKPFEKYIYVYAKYNIDFLHSCII